jgi:hypothetical protein
MKNILFVFAAMVAFTAVTKAQSIELSPFAGYTFADQFNFDQGTARIGDGFTYGGTLSMISNKVNVIELTYSRLDAEVSAYSEYHEIDMLSPAGLNYIFLGGTRLFPLRRRPIEFFAGMNFGVAILGSKEDDFESSTKMAVGFNGGMKYFFSKTIGLRIQPNLNFPITNPGGEYWWNPATETDAGAPSVVPFLQFGVTAGLVYKF